MPEFHDNELRAFKPVRDGISESVTEDAPSGRALDLLTTRQVLLVLGRYARRTVTELAALLNITRDTAHRDLRAARSTIRQYVAGPAVGGRVHADSRTCCLCGREPRLPGRMVGAGCEHRWQRVVALRSARRGRPRSPAPGGRGGGSVA